MINTTDERGPMKRDQRTTMTTDIHLPTPSLDIDRFAAAGNYARVVREHTRGAEFGPDTCAYAAKGGHGDIVARIHDQGGHWDERTCALAAAGGYLNLLEYVRFDVSPPCPWDERACALAARGGHIDVLKWLHKHGCPWDAMTCAEAAARGDLTMLSYARGHGCCWDERTITAAASKGNLNILSYLKSAGCPWSVDATQAALENGHMNVYLLLKELGCPTRDSSHLGDPALIQSKSVAITDSTPVVDSSQLDRREVEIQLAKSDITSLTHLATHGYRVARFTATGIVITSV